MVTFVPVCHQILQVYMYENVTYGPSHKRVPLYLGVHSVSKEIHCMTVENWVSFIEEYR